MSPARRRAFAAAVALACCVACRFAQARPPTLYGTPAFESPVHGGPDDLLLLAGTGFTAGDTVAYRRARSDAPPAPLAVVSYANIPYSLTVRLPAALRRHHGYWLWVRNRRGQRSNAVPINDARPLWFAPSVLYTSADPGRTGRTLRLVGRNLRASAGGGERIRLVGPRTLTLNARAAGRPANSTDDYVAVVTVPRLPAGRYRVAYSRNGGTWVMVAAERLEVRADPPARPRFVVGSTALGGCRPNDGRDDTRCLTAAIRAAAAAGGGEVVLGAGTWDLRDSTGGTVAAGDGILMPPRVSLVGAGRRVTRLIRHEQWSSGGGNFTFTLAGANLVTGIRFEDEHRFAPGDAPRPWFQLGVHPGTHPAGAVADVVVTNNVFDAVYEAIVDSGAPLVRLIVTHNRFAAYYVDLELPGNRFLVNQPYRIDDSIIADNVFDPSGYLDVPRQTGVIASEIGASHRLVFSGNVADGASRRFLAAPTDPGGWRAAFFWNLNGNQEELLVADNTARCTGDKIGDGEAFAYDNNGNTFGFNGTRTVLDAKSSTVTLPGPLLDRQSGRPVDVGTYYVGHWLQIVRGPGLGQARKIRAYRRDRRSGRITFTVAPAWDVVPTAGRSEAVIGREFWQAYTIGNLVDNRRPPCAKSNRGRPKAGVIALWAQTTDSVVAGNRQYDSDGILLQHAFFAAAPGCPGCEPSTFLQYFNEIRANTIDGEYRWDSACSLSGIEASYAASPTPAAPPPILGYGLSIAHNTIIRADGDRGGAIDFLPTWYAGPDRARGALINNALIDHNVLRSIDGPPPADACGYHQSARIGIKLDGPRRVSNTVLYANRCEQVSEPLQDHGRGTVKVCRGAAAADRCDCAGASNFPAARPGDSETASAASAPR